MNGRHRVDREAAISAGLHSAPRNEPEIAPHAFRRVLSHYCTGVVVITSMTESGPVGLTCQSFSALSLRPPLVLFSPAQASTSWPLIRAQGIFAVNVLNHDQQQVAAAFSRRGADGGDKFAGIGWQPGPVGLPVLDDTLAHLECRLHSEFPGGDHQIVVGRVLSLAESHDEDGLPLLFFRSEYHRLHHAPPGP
ncbi:MAG TPA: flavin reductase family protein [Pseudonocardiaceae bacterium]|jgi:3-hydroxy-9,10-secoandrosta-1,3,5(10)-triene-9,17-dione monooxygenase reductase component|nr:flavin reductase family protein [Pseudonocardiaceae bacterium]